ncbi:MAG: hypothetical protein WAV53_00490, partial [Anaerolineae bacterium]
GHGYENDQCESVLIRVLILLPGGTPIRRGFNRSPAAGRSLGSYVPPQIRPDALRTASSVVRLVRDTEVSP